MNDASNESEHDTSELRLTAARFVLQLAYSWELPAIANRAIDRGIYSPALAELATTREPVGSECRPMFVHALRELGIAWPSRDEATRTVLLHHLGRIVDGTADAREEVVYVVEYVAHCGILYQPIGDRIDTQSAFGRLAACYYGYLGFRGELVRSSGLALDELARRVARECMVELTTDSANDPSDAG